MSFSFPFWQLSSIKDPASIGPLFQDDNVQLLLLTDTLEELPGATTNDGKFCFSGHSSRASLLWTQKNLTEIWIRGIWILSGCWKCSFLSTNIKKIKIEKEKKTHSCNDLDTGSVRTEDAKCNILPFDAYVLEYIDWIYLVSSYESLLPGFT